MLSISANVTTAILYGLATASAWLGARGVAETGAGSTFARANLPKAFLWIAIVAHAYALGEALFSGEGLNIGFSHAVSLLVWLTVLSYVVLGNDARLTRLAGLYLAPIATVIAFLPEILPAQRVVNYATWAFRAHFVVAILAYALFTVAALHALLMLFLERQLQSGTVLSADQHLPPLLRLEKLLFQLLGVAFVLLTATIITGTFFSEELFGKPFKVGYKTVFAMTSWVIFGGLLVGHWKFGWRGKLAVRWTLFGFVLLLLSYVGSKFVSEIILGRIQ
jgi:ABC-type uncharacterized transport system permease subunit